MVFEPTRGWNLWVQRQHRLGGCERQRYSAWAIAGPLHIHDLITIDAENGRDVYQSSASTFTTSD